MKPGNLAIGLLSACAMLAVLAIARLLVVSVETPDMEIREVEISTFEEPPPPPPPEDPPPDAPPPPPALTDLSDVPDPSRIPIPEANVPMDITLPVETFFSDVPIAPLPEAPVEAPRPRAQAPAPRVETPPAPTPAPAPPPPVVKSHYQVDELDGTPRLIRHTAPPFPQSLARQGVTRGTVVLEVELSAVGAVSVRRVISASHADLVSPARRVAASARFTPPTRRGQPVRAIMRWPITIQR